MWEAFTYAALRKKDALPRLLNLLPEPARTEVSKVAAEAASLSAAELAARIADLRAADLNRLGAQPTIPTPLLEWKLRRSSAA